MTFSGALTLTDLNDFITPSQACIKPVEEIKDEDSEAIPGAASTQIQIDASGQYHEVSLPNTGSPSSQGPTKKKLKKAEISLNDCLACSGCITSAESILITQQSHIEVLEVLAANPPISSPNHRIPVLSIAPQSLASLATSISASNDTTPPSLRRILRRVQAFCTSQLGFHRVYDTTFARHVTLLEHAREFQERKSKPSTSAPIIEGETRLPMLSSACPGWVCYAEKAHSEMIPFMSRTKSPQQVMGTLVKEWMAKHWGKTPDQIYHVSVMPCYDKKLEASRQDFFNDIFSTRDVDCVLTTGELETLMRERNWDLNKPVPGEDDELPLSDLIPNDSTALPELIDHPGTSSGSYLHSLIYLLSASYPSPNTLELSSKMIRSSDYEEYVLRDTKTGAVVFKGAKCFGFRNLQNVVRKVGKEAGVQVSRGAAGRMVGRRRAAVTGDDAKGYDYVEVMACPGGCVNGGGQIRPQKKNITVTVKPNDKDEEGFTRDWVMDGVQPVPPLNESLTKMVSAPDDEISTLPSTKWGDKDWIQTVEKAYWHVVEDTPKYNASFPPTPPVSPPQTPPLVALGTAFTAAALSNVTEPVSGRATSSERGAGDTPLSLPSTSPLSSDLSAFASHSDADNLALQILNDLCLAPRSSSASRPPVEVGAPEKGGFIKWSEFREHETIGGGGEGEGEVRRRLFRTTFRAVKNDDVLGLNVKW